MKKILIVILVLTMMIGVLTACGFGGGSSIPPGNGGGGGSAPLPDDSELPDEEKTSDDEDEYIDPCPCCPDCIQEECECLECGENKNCECILPGGGIVMQPITIDIGIRVESSDTDPTCPFPGDCRMDASGTIRLTMYWEDDRNGYFGISEDGVGEYLYFGTHYWDSEGRTILGHVTPGTTYTFSAMATIPNAGNDGVIKVGFNFSGEDEVEMNWANGEVLPFWGMMGIIHGWFSGTYVFFENEVDTSGLIDTDTYEYDEDLGMWILKLPLNDDGMQKEFVWENNLTITVYITPAYQP